MKFLINFLFLIISSIAIATNEVNFSIVDDSNGKINLLVQTQDDGQQRLILDLPTPYIINRSQSIPSGKYFSSSINSLKISGTIILEHDAKKGDIQIGELNTETGKAELCTNKFDSVCQVSFSKGMFNLFVIHLN